MTDKAKKILKDMFNSGTSEGRAVALCLMRIALNGDEQREDNHLITCAEEIQEWADVFIRRLKQT